MYGCQIWGEEYTSSKSGHTLGVFDNGLRKKILEPKREQTTGIRMIYTSPKTQFKGDEIGKGRRAYEGRDTPKGFY